MPSPLPNGKQQFLDGTGAPLAGGTVAHYVPGTTTPATTWQDSAGTIPNANPLTLDGYGEATIWGAGAYRQIVKDASGNLIWDQVTTTTVSAAMAPVVGAASTSAATAALTYTAPGTGAVPVSVSAKLSQWVASADYGCVGDGATDDTANFMQAAAVALSLGKSLLVSGTSGSTIRLTSAQTVTVPLVFAGGLLQPDSGVVVKLAAGVIAPLVQIFSGSGSVAVQKVPLIPVAWYGAKGDGVTDDAGAVNGAIYDLTAAGYTGILYFHPGSFHLTQTVSVQSDNISFAGAGTGQTALSFANGSSHGIQIGTNSSKVVYNTRISDMAIYGSSKTGGYGISLNSAANAIIQRVTFTNLPNGIYCQYINNVTVEDCIILLLNSSGYEAAIRWYSIASAAETSNVLSLNNVTINCYSNNATGILVDGPCQTLRINSVGIIHAAYGLVISNTQASSQYFPQFVFANDLEIDGVLHNCVAINGGRHLRFVNCDFFNNFAGSTSDTDCIFITSDGTASVTTAIWFTACRIAGAQHSGINCTAKNVDISACYIGDNSLAGSGSYPGISLGNEGGTNGAAASVNITGGQIGAIFGDIGNQSYGVTAASGVTRVTINGVDFSNCVTGAIQDTTGGLGNVQWSGCIDINGTELASRLPMLSSNPGAPVEGVMWENITTHTLNVCLGGVVKTVTTN